MLKQRSMDDVALQQKAYVKTEILEKKTYT